MVALWMQTRRAWPPPHDHQQEMPNGRPQAFATAGGGGGSGSERQRRGWLSKHAVECGRTQGEPHACAAEVHGESSARLMGWVMDSTERMGPSGVRSAGMRSAGMHLARRRLATTFHPAADTKSSCQEPTKGGATPANPPKVRLSPRPSPWRDRVGCIRRESAAPAPAYSAAETIEPSGSPPSSISGGAGSPRGATAARTGSAGAARCTRLWMKPSLAITPGPMMKG